MVIKWIYIDQKKYIQLEQKICHLEKKKEPKYSLYFIDFLML